MPLASGTRLGPYEIVSLLGTGGMGEVYRARDPRMGRDVAIKISAERFSDRFDREVRAVAALNHPNICHVYDVGPNYLVMELVEGPTLAERTKPGSIPLDEALTIARQIGDALEAAHEKGIIHRDLKPANIKIKPDGTVKVLDFGLAKIAEQAAVAGAPDASPTLPMGATTAGQIMGTAAYMAPEQARGKTVDKRADIWAFGVVLYEMLSGRRLFEGETISDTLAGVLTKEPGWERVPAKAQRLVMSCLEKDSRRRLRDIGDAWRLLEDVPAAAFHRGLVWKAVSGVLALTCVVLVWAHWRTMPPAIEQPSMRLHLDLGSDVSLSTSGGPAAVLSPNGTRLVFVSRGEDGIRRLFARWLDQHKTVQLPGTEGANAPFFSPDGEWVGFFAQGKLKKIRVEGGETISLCNAPAGRGATWAEDGSIIASLDPQTTLAQIPGNGGKPVPITDLRAEAGEFSHRWPQALPGGKAVLFTTSTRYANFDDAGIEVVSLKDHRRKVVVERGGMYPRYLPSGHLTYVTKGTLFAVPFDLERLEVVGPPTPLEEVASTSSLGFAQLDFSRSGILLYVAGRTQIQRTIQWLDASGTTAALGAEPDNYVSLRLSPDGRRVASTVSQGVNSGLWVHDWQRASNTPLTDKEVDGYPVWSHDGKFVVFRAAGGMYWVRADGSNKPQPLTRSKSLQLPSSFTPDDTRLAFSELTAGGAAEIRTVPVEKTSGQMRAGEPQTFLKTPTISTFATFSPDGRWLAYANAEGGVFEVYVRAFPDADAEQVQISNNGGVMPVWSENKQEIFYRTEDQRIMVAGYAVHDGMFLPEKPRIWCATQLVNVGLAVNYDLAPDGKRFAVLMPAKSQEPQENLNHVMLALNFFDEVRRRVAGQTK